ncbi:hypothetical protein L873DRAFT_668827 [Choiromyces venosus 120613-1]|uniref:Uncharacterized protein n=1 Tax=Choiromyces venosus 120613-1 TaxID=1336337 RepID=A0A3N4IU67_9PEZI|nr:hypothetical protein L873DRAFT_668827 [Choiromyces venosus 120613-1]
MCGFVRVMCDGFLAFFLVGVYITKENDPSFSTTNKHNITQPPFTEQQQMANLQQPNAQNVSGAVRGAVRKIVDGCHDLSTEAARIQMLQQLLNGQQELREQLRDQWTTTFAHDALQHLWEPSRTTPLSSWNSH